jgi:hypothetical protein
MRFAPVRRPGPAQQAVPDAHRHREPAARADLLQPLDPGRRQPPSHLGIELTRLVRALAELLENRLRGAQIHRPARVSLHLAGHQEQD